MLKRRKKNSKKQDKPPEPDAPMICTREKDKTKRKRAPTCPGSEMLI